MFCVNCDREFDPIRHRWLCPFCKVKNSCCEGAPLPPEGYRCDFDGDRAGTPVHEEV